MRIREVGFTLLLFIATGQGSIGAEETDSPNAQAHAVLAADPSTQRLGLVDAEGKLVWEYTIRDCLDACLLPNSNLLFQVSWTRVIEVSPDKTIVWSYVAPASSEFFPAPQVNSVQRLEDGRTLVAEAGTDRLLEVDAQGNVAAEIPLLRLRPSFDQTTFAARKLPAGTYLVAQGPDQVVWEYNPDGEVIWEYNAKAPVSSAQRLANGNTLVACGSVGRVDEVTPTGQVVWQLKRGELLGISLVWIRYAERLANGNTLIVNSHAGMPQPQILEVAPDKSVVWFFRDFEHFGNALIVGRIVNQPR